VTATHDGRPNIEDQTSKIDLPVAIVTGAGSGIGRALALILADAGWAQVLASRRAGTLEQTVRLAVDRGAPADAMAVAPTDVRDPSQCAALVQTAASRFGRIDAVANVAGRAVMCPMEQVTPEQWRDVVDTNLSGPLHLTARAWPHLQADGGGMVVNVSSMASLDPFPGFAMYAPAKAGVNMLTHCTAQEGEAVGIRAVAIVPGVVETPMLRSLFDETTVPGANALAPEDVAGVIADCILGRRSFRSGQHIEVPSPDRDDLKSE